MMRFGRIVGIFAVMAAFAFALPGAASAHEHRDIADGRFTVVVGFIEEPAYTGFLNGLSLRVADNSMATPAADGGEATGAPVEGLEETLQAEVIFGDQSATLTLEPKWRSPGEYQAWMVPMAAGDYSFRISGTIGDVAVDETFTSSPDTFSSVEDQATIQFPKAPASASAAPVFGTMSGGGFDGGAAGGALFGIVAGAAGAVLVGRRMRRPAAQAVVARMGSGD